VNGFREGSVFEPVGVELLGNTGAVDDEETGKRNEQRSSVPCIDSREHSSATHRSVDMAEAGSVDASVNVNYLQEGEMVDTQRIGKVDEQQTCVGCIGSSDNSTVFELVNELREASLFEPFGVELLENRGAVDDEGLNKKYAHGSSFPGFDTGEHSSSSDRFVDVAESGSVDASVNVDACILFHFRT
jgi:hypothetical protein